MIARVLTTVCVVGLFAPKLIATEPAAKPTTRSLTAIQKDVSDALRSEATTRRAGDNTPQVLRLVDLYLELAAHPRRDTSPLIADLGQQVRLRLQTVRDRVKRKIPEKKSVANDKQNAPAKVAKSSDRVLAQQAPPAGAQGGQQQAAGGQGAAPAVATRPTDFGPELVELIEAVVSPATWKINGGNGAVVYYSPLHVLVVSAPDDVHAQVGDVLRQLNAAQRQQDGTQAVTEVGLVQGADAQ